MRPWAYAVCYCFPFQTGHNECNKQGERVAQRYRLLCHRWVSPQSPASLAARGGERVTQGAPPMFAHLTVAVV